MVLDAPEEEKKVEYEALGGIDEESKENQDPNTSNQKRIKLKVLDEKLEKLTETFNQKIQNVENILYKISESIAGIENLTDVKAKDQHIKENADLKKEQNETS